LKDGLNILGVLDSIRQESDTMSQAFLHLQAVLDSTVVEDLFIVGSWSENGTQKYATEKRTISHWRDYLQDLEGTNIQNFIQ